MVTIRIMTLVYAIAAVIKANGGMKKMTQVSWVYKHEFSKRIELESPGWSGFVENSKPDQT